ncbi:unnamed protein product [Penicillium camemberti]|uniref:Str. FM013 n=1 Tax=Penicillium camemberti (strain FM 013) TaxID=1429867 RepID=A0A0G4NV82_PENC3|nr:unnamed protein product [Penicillium camemberti]
MKKRIDKIGDTLILERGHKAQLWLVEGDKEKHRVEKSTPFLKEIRHLSITQPRPLKPSECTPYYTPGLLIINSPGIHRLASIRHTRMAKLRHLTSWLPYHRARAFSPLILTLRGVKQTIFDHRTSCRMEKPLLVTSESVGKQARTTRGCC